MGHRKKGARKHPRTAAQKRATANMIAHNRGAVKHARTNPKGRNQTQRQYKASLRNLSKADRATGHPTAAAKLAHRAAVAPPHGARRNPIRNRVRGRRRRNPLKETRSVAIVGRGGEMHRARRARKRPGRVYAPQGVAIVSSYKNRRTGRRIKFTDAFRVNPMGDKWNYAIGVVTLAGGVLIYCGLHAWWVTRPPSGAKHAAMGKDASLRIAAPPRASTYLVLGSSAAAMGVGAMLLRKRSPKIAWALGGFAAAGAVYTTILVGRNVILSRIFKVKKGNEISWPNRGYADVQQNVGEAMWKEIDRQDKDPTYAGWQEITVDGVAMLPESYAYEGPDGDPFPTLAQGAILTNTTGGLEGFLFPTLRRGGAPAPKTNAAGGTPKKKAFELLAPPEQRAAIPNHAAGCAGAGACTCPGKTAGGQPLTAAELRDEAGKLRTAGYAGAADKMLAQAAALESSAAGAGNRAAGVPDAEALTVDGRVYAPVGVDMAKVIAAAEARGAQDALRRAGATPPPAPQAPARAPADAAPVHPRRPNPPAPPPAFQVPSPWANPINPPRRTARSH